MHSSWLLLRTYLSWFKQSLALCEISKSWRKYKQCRIALVHRWESEYKKADWGHDSHIWGCRSRQLASDSIRYQLIVFLLRSISKLWSKLAYWTLPPEFLELDDGQLCVCEFTLLTLIPIPIKIECLGWNGYMAYRYGPVLIAFTVRLCIVRNFTSLQFLYLEGNKSLRYSELLSNVKDIVLEVEDSILTSKQVERSRWIHQRRGLFIRSNAFNLQILGWSMSKHFTLHIFCNCLPGTRISRRS